jgi:hypothetical protein
MSVASQFRGLSLADAFERVVAASAGAARR